MAEIMNCPFCGGIARVRPVFSINGEDYYKVKCTECGANTTASAEVPEVISLWNRRLSTSMRCGDCKHYEPINTDGHGWCLNGMVREVSPHDYCSWAEAKDTDYGDHGDRCWYCGGKLIWQSDFNYSDVYGDDEEGIVSYLRCSNCGADVEYSLVDREEDE